MRIRKHNLHFSAGDRFLRHKTASGQCKPVAIQRDLNVIGICNAAIFAKGVVQILKLKSQAEVQRMGGKFARCRVVRSEWKAGVKVYHAEFDREQNIIIIRRLHGHIAVVVVRHGARIVYGHIESAYKLRNPLASRDLAATCCEHRAKKSRDNE